MPSNKELIERAYGAWIKYRRGAGVPMPTFTASTVEDYGGKTYVVLRSGGQPVDIYRYYAPGDQLMRLLVRWPGPYSKRAQRRRTKAAA